ncbi:putative aminoglycoside phosphotransferase [compost metagenome]|uniref:phosphotransferase family protein n=1 Tax=Pseudomonas TaxID=286 RepID=UPI0003F8799E|nr:MULTISPECIES: phosphotransferase family protein [Pseudomonas]MCW2270767.1 aminoglycoside phosphotransferase (APT) family kinase protein [Pseudomonas sp. JUb96]PRA66009.1 phosphotransferase family protein [Pseudomonas sp. MYb187]
MSSLNAASQAAGVHSDAANDQPLLAFIGEQAQAQRVVILQRKQLSGGAIQENWLLDVQLDGGPFAGVQRWVLRSDAASALPASLSRAQEFAVLSRVHRAGVKVPRPLWLCRDPAVIGRAFFLMEWVPGIAAGRLLSGQCAAEGNAQLAAELGANLARLHQLRPPCGELGFLPLPDVAPALASIATHRAFLDRHQGAHPVLEWGLRWCELNAPTDSTVCLLHRDYRSGNYLANEAGLQAVLDWEFTGWGDPREDIGWFCARCWRFARPDLEAGGIGQLEDFLRGYREVSALHIDREQLDYWQVMATLRWAVIALQQTQRHLSGEEPSLELALTGRLLPELELEILRLTSGAKQ